MPCYSKQRPRRDPRPLQRPPPDEQDDHRGGHRQAVEAGGGGQRNSVVLREGLREFRFAYLDPESDGDVWEERWDAAERRVMPRAVRLSYRTDAGREVRWTFPIMVSLLAQ